MRTQEGQLRKNTGGVARLGPLTAVRCVAANVNDDDVVTERYRENDKDHDREVPRNVRISSHAGIRTYIFIFLCFVFLFFACLPTLRFRAEMLKPSLKARPKQ